MDKANYIFSLIMEIYFKNIDISSIIDLDTDEKVDTFCSWTDQDIMKEILSGKNPDLAQAKEMLCMLLKGIDNFDIKNCILLNESKSDDSKTFVPVKIRIVDDPSGPCTAIPTVRYHVDGIHMAENDAYHRYLEIPKPET
jgi:hypothetical protein